MPLWQGFRGVDGNFGGSGLQPVIQAEKRAEARAARKARDHALYQSAGLLIMAGLVDSKTGKPVDDAAALLGALAGLNDLSRDNPKWSDWKIRGQVLLKRKKADAQA
ncbi:conjugal transfer protein TraD [Escherichia coli]|nr:conjugal transfer protein TraD [Escherichia coli]